MAKKKSRNIKKILIFIFSIFVIILISLLSYSVYVYQNSEEEEQGFFICNEDKTICELSQHIHAHIDMNICGQNYTFPRETGRTDEMHTHKEKNLMHWHAPVHVDPATQAVLPQDQNRVTVRAFLDQAKYAFPETCPNNQTPVLEVIVNNEIKPEGLDYVWIDGDNVVINYE